MKDQKVLVAFIGCFCRGKHTGAPSLAPRILSLQGGSELKKLTLCSDCHDLLRYAISRRELCPLDPKPTCKHCPVHCYNSQYRAKIKTVMRFAGLRLLLRGRIDLLFHYFF